MMEFFKKKSNIIMLILIAVFVVGGLISASVLKDKSTNNRMQDMTVSVEPSVTEQPIETAKPSEVSKDTANPTTASTAEQTPTSVPSVTPNPTTESKPTTEPKPTTESKPATAPKPTAAPKPTTEPKPTAAQKPTTTPAAVPNPTVEPTKTPDPEPVPEKKTCTVSIYCDAVLSHMDQLKPGKEVCIPSGGCILSSKTIEFDDGETVLDALIRACNRAGIQLEYAYTPAYGSYYVEGINNLYEFDCGTSSGWKYKVNGSSPNYGCSDYRLSNGDSIVWNYTCSE